MRLRLRSACPDLAPLVRQRLERAGHEVDREAAPGTCLALRYGPGASVEDVSELLDLLRPLLPEVIADPDLAEVDAEFELDDGIDHHATDVVVFAESLSMADEVAGLLGAAGIEPRAVEIGPVQESRIENEQPAGPRVQTVRWLLDRGGRDAPPATGPDAPEAIHVFLRDPPLDDAGFRLRHPIRIETDRYERGLELARRIESAGFGRPEVGPLPPLEGTRFAVAGGPLGRRPAVLEGLVGVVAGLLSETGVDAVEHPIDVDRGTGGAFARIALPIGAWAGGSLWPTGGDSPRRWRIVIVNDDSERAGDLERRLIAAGLPRIERQDLDPDAVGFTISSGAARAHPAVGRTIAEAVTGAMAAAGVDPSFELLAGLPLGDDSEEVRIQYPAARSRDATLLGAVASACAACEFYLYAEVESDHAELYEELGAYPFKSHVFRPEAQSKARIRYGGASIALVEHLAALVHTRTGFGPVLEHAWGDEDDDVYLELPRPEASPGEADAPTAGEAPRIEDWLDDGPRGEVIDFLSIEEDRVRIGPVVLPRRVGPPDPLVPPAELFGHYCLDDRTARTLVHVAESVALREPCLLEGETSVSKTSIVLYLASLLAQPIARINLNGQTDTGELIGRFIPRNSAALVTEDPEALLESIEPQEPETREILRTARRETRRLTRDEADRIATNERMSLHPWQWADGLIVTALKRGWWVILDELNLAEPQILERLNPVLERIPSIVLTEHDNSVLGPGGTPIDPSFRIFATMNPAEYSGRTQLSPAYRDRWRGYLNVPPTSESDYLAMLRYQVTGQHPAVSVRGQPYRGGTGAAPMAGLAGMPGIDPFLVALARFQVRVEEATRGGDHGPRLGSRRRERYVFTRRGLLSIMEYLDRSLTEHGRPRRASLRTALLRYFVGRIDSAEDQVALAGLLDECGIGPERWTIPDDDR